MKIIFNKIKIQMESIENITQEEFDAFAYHHRKHEYNQQEAMDLVNLVRKYIYNAPSCINCNNNIREVKTNANEFYLANKDKIQLILDARNAPVQNNTPNKNNK